MISIDPEVRNTTLAEIRNFTFLARRKLKPRDSEDPSWKFYGYLYQPSYQAVSQEFSDLKSGAQYYAAIFCQNQMNLESVNSTVLNWTQSDNGGRIFRLHMNFNQTLSKAQQRILACALSYIVKIPLNTIYTQDSQTCEVNQTALRMMQQGTTNISNLSSTTANTTSTSSNSSVPAATNNSSNNPSSANDTTIENTANTTKEEINITYAWFALPDPTAEVSDSHLKLKTLLNQPNFIENLSNMTLSQGLRLPYVNTYSFYVEDRISPSAPSIDELLDTEFEIYASYVKFEIKLNFSCFVYYGLGFKNSIKPTANLLKDRADGNNSFLITADRQYVFQNLTAKFNITSPLMNPETDYVLYLALSSDNPGSEASFSDVLEFKFKTIAKFAQNICFITLGLFIFLLFFYFEVIII